MVVRSRSLNHSSVFGSDLTQSPPSRYLPLGNSWSYTPSSVASATTSSASSGAMSGSLVTLIRSSGNSKSDAKSSGASEAEQYERTVDVSNAPSPAPQ